MVKTLCAHEGCTNYARTGEIYLRYGAVVTKTIRTHEGGAKQVVKVGVCVQHGAALRPKCLHKGFANQAKVGGVCLRHGTAKPCSHEGGTTQGVRKEGF